MQPIRKTLILAEVDSGEPRPPRSREQAAQREEVVVLAFVPHPVTPVAAHQMRDEAGVALDDALGQLFVLEPDGDGRERRVVPRLPV